MTVVLMFVIGSSFFGGAMFGYHARQREVSKRIRHRRYMVLTAEKEGPRYSDDRVAELDLISNVLDSTEPMPRGL